MPNITFVVEGVVGLSEPEIGAKIQKQLQKEKKQVIKRYVRVPDFSNYYATTKDGANLVVQLPYKFAQASEKK